MQYGNELYHYGRLGMKWGRRTARSSSTSPKKQIVPSADYLKKKELKKKHVKELSNDELKAVTNRIQLENQYKKLSAEHVVKGKNYVDKFVKTGATIAAVGTTVGTIYKQSENIRSLLRKINMPKAMNIDADILKSLK